MTRLDADKFLEDVTGKHAGAYVRSLDAMLIAEATGNAPALRLARRQFKEVVWVSIVMAEVLGATISLQEAAPISNVLTFKNHVCAAGCDRPRMARFAAEPTQTILPRVTFDQAVQDMVTRTP
ncbi:MAG: hypothetical protein O7A04_06035, partial [Acidobacteria bacterium]|nr:hypothetical protein [Acidobacteriota bacterium]